MRLTDLIGLCGVAAIAYGLLLVHASLPCLWVGGLFLFMAVANRQKRKGVSRNV